MNSIPRQKLLLFIAIGVAGAWAADMLIINPLLKSWRERSTAITRLRKDVSQGTQLLARERNIRARWDEMRTNTLPFEQSAAESQVLKAFDRWSDTSGISITSVKPQWKRNADDYTTLECRVDAAGDLRTITRFLFEVEKDPVALKVESVELATRDNDGRQLTLALQVSGLLLNPPEQQ